MGKTLIKITQVFGILGPGSVLNNDRSCSYKIDFYYFLFSNRVFTAE